MTVFLKVEPITLKFKREVNSQKIHTNNSSKCSNSNKKIKYSSSKIEELVRDCIERRKLTFVDTVLELGVSPSTVRRVCRTLKIGRYGEQIPSGLRSKSSQQPYGWKSKMGVLEKDPTEWSRVEMMFKLRQQGQSLHRIAAELTRQKVPTKNGGQWFAKTISQILKFNEQFLNDFKKTIGGSHE